MSLLALAGGLGSLFTGLSSSQMLGLGLGASALSGLSNVGLQHINSNINRGREDNAIQRQMADLKAAGLNPLMAASLGGSSSSSQTSAQFDPSALFKTAETYMAKKQLSLATTSAELQNEKQKYENEILKETLKQYQAKGLPGYSTIGKSLQDIVYLIEQSKNGVHTGVPIIDTGLKQSRNFWNLLTSKESYEGYQDPSNPFVDFVGHSKEAASIHKEKVNVKRNVEDSLWDNGVATYGTYTFYKQDERQFKVYDKGKYVGTYYAPDLIKFVK